MWTEPVISTNWALVWFVLSLLPFLFASKLASNPGSQIRERLGKSAWFILPLIALIVRLVPAIILPVGAGYDIDSFRLTGEAILSGDDVYTSAAAGRHPYLPFQMYIIGLSLFLSQSSSLPFVVLIKMFPVLADAAITVVIWFTATKSGENQRQAWWLALLFVFNPVSILTTSYHGQFDAITLFLLLLAWYFWRFGRRLLPSAFFLGLAIVNKSWPIIFLPVVLLRLRRARRIALYGLISLSIPIALTVLYTLALSDDPSVMLRRALTHSGVREWWGVSGLLALGGSYWATLAGAGQELYGIRFFVLAAAGGGALWHTRQQPAVHALVTVLLSIFAVSVGMGLQWLVWLVPFAILAQDTTWLRRYSLAAVLLLIPHLYGIHLMSWAYRWFEPEKVNILVKAVALPVWIVIILWLIDRWRRREKLQQGSDTNEESSWRPVMLFAFVTVLAAIGWLAWQITDLALFHPNNHTDNLYNQGVILRSAAAPSDVMLESSYLHWYFDDVELVRPEDWHRGISLLLQKQVAQTITSNSSWILRLPHLIWITVWIAIAGWITAKTLKKGSASSLAVLCVFVVIVLLVLNRWSPEVLSGAFLDDVPGAVFALLGVGILLSPSFDCRRVVIAAAAFGFAFLAKDFNLIWAGIGWILVLIAWWRDTVRDIRQLLLASVIFFAVLLLVYSPKIIWNLQELDKPLTTSARTALNARLLPDYGEHYLYRFTGDPVPSSYWEAARSAGFFSIIWEGVGKTLQALIFQWHTWVLVVLVLPIYFMFRRTNSQLTHLLTSLAVSLAAYFLLFGFQLGEPAQNRYWLVPLTLGIIFVAVTASTPFIQTKGHQRRQPILSLALAAIFIVAALSFSKFQQQSEGFFNDGRPYSDEVEKSIASDYQEGTALLLHTNRGVQIWARHPQLAVAAVKPWMLLSLTHDQITLFVNEFNITKAVIASEYDGVLDLLKSSGFIEEQRVDNDVILDRQLLGRDLPFAQTNIPGLGVVSASVAPSASPRTQSRQAVINWGLLGMVRNDIEICFMIAGQTDKLIWRQCLALDQDSIMPSLGVNETVELIYDLEAEALQRSGSYTVSAEIIPSGPDIAAGEAILIDQIEVERNHKIDADWENLISIANFKIEKGKNWLVMTPQWKAENAIDKSYKTFAHVIDQRSGEIVSQYDAVPVEWTRPTDSWTQGELIQDRIILSLEDLPPGKYIVQIGFYNPTNGLRLPVFSADGERYSDDALPITMFDHR